MKKIKLALAISGSFCNMEKSINVMKELSSNYDILPIISFNVARMNTRFGTAKETRKKIEDVCLKKVIDSIEDAEPIGPKNMADIIAVCPCTGNTLAKIVNAITDTPVTMAVKSMLRVRKPVVICFASNDGLGASAQNLAKARNTKNIYLVPLKKDDPINKPNSLVADFSELGNTMSKIDLTNKLY